MGAVVPPATATSIATRTPHRALRTRSSCRLPTHGAQPMSQRWTTSFLPAACPRDASPPLARRWPLIASAQTLPGASVRTDVNSGTALSSSRPQTVIPAARSSPAETKRRWPTAAAKTGCLVGVADLADDARFTHLRDVDFHQVDPAAVSADHDLTKWPHATRRVDRGQAADLVRRVAFLIRRDAQKRRSAVHMYDAQHDRAARFLSRRHEHRTVDAAPSDAPLSDLVEPGPLGQPHRASAGHSEPVYIARILERIKARMVRPNVRSVPNASRRVVLAPRHEAGPIRCERQ